MDLRRTQKLTLFLLAVYGAWLVFVWFALRFAADRLWWGTVLLFTPRWFWAIPLPLVALAVSVLARRWLVYVGLLTLAVLAVMGFELPWGKLVPRGAPRQTLRVLSCNCDNGKLQIEKLRGLIADFHPDVIALQSIRPEDFKALFLHGDWHTVFDFRLGLASRLPIRENKMLERDDFVEEGISRDEFRHYWLELDGETLHFFNVHLQSPRFGLRAVMHHGWEGAARLEYFTRMRRIEAAAIHDWIEPYPEAVVAGDFNTPLESPTYRENFGDYLNAFSSAGWGFGNTFRPTWWTGLRIDHILAGSGWWCRWCRVGPYVGPEHRPVMAELAR